jgi:hypothetical protein
VALPDGIPAAPTAIADIHGIRFGITLNVTMPAVAQ